MVTEIRPDHVAIYIRWSTDDQSEGTTLAVQSEACQHYVKSQGWTVRDDLTFIDEGHSGGSLDRPAITRLRKAIKDGNVDCVVVFKLDRLSRSVIDTVTLVLQEWEDLTYLKSAREPVDTTTAMGKQFFYMLVSYAEWERNVIRERMFGGKLRRAKEGRSPGMPTAYGYRKGPTAGSMEVIEEQAIVVRLVYDMAERGESVRRITFHLNGAGYPSRKGAPWGTSMVSKMLHNPIYTGQLVWGRRRTNPRYKKAPGERQFKYAEPHVDRQAATIPAIISREQYDRVQSLMAGNAKMTPGASGSEYLLTGLLKCARCGRFMQFNGTDKWTYYRCGGRIQQGLCDSPSIPSAQLEQAVIMHLQARYAKTVDDQVGSTGHQVRIKHLDSLESELETVRSALARLEGQEKRVNQDYLQERITADERRQLLAHVADDRGRLLPQEGSLTQQLEEARTKLDIVKVQVAHLQSVNAWPELPMAQRKQILRLFIAEVRAARVDKTSIEVDIEWTDEPPEQTVVRSASTTE